MDCIRVGDFELYPAERRLCAAGKPVELGARAFDLLLVLVEYQGRLVTKSTLLERVWPRLVVDENNLPAQIASFRRVLAPAPFAPCRDTVTGWILRCPNARWRSGAAARCAAATLATAPGMAESARTPGRARRRCAQLAGGSGSILPGHHRRGGRGRQDQDRAGNPGA